MRLFLLLLVLLPLSIAWASEVLYPKSDVILKDENIVLIGRKTDDQKKTDVKLNGGKAEVVNNKGVYYSRLKLSEGQNNLSVDGQEIKLSLNSKAELKDITYHYHPMLIDDGECGECHVLTNGFTRTDLKTNDQGMIVCVDCHDEKLEAKNLHGPVGAGSCFACHDPHGSVNMRMLRMVKSEICNMCHPPGQLDANHAKIQESNAQYPKCLDCHDPHGSAEKFHLHKPIAHYVK